MKKIFAVLSATTMLTLSSYAMAEEGSAQTNVEYKSDGGYQATTKSSGTNDAGTYNKSKSTTDVSVDSKGHVSKKIKTSGLSDAKGLHNKKTHSGVVKTEEKDNGGYTKSVNDSSTDAAGTNHSVKD